jgi:hypothetical protein
MRLCTDQLHLTSESRFASVMVITSKSGICLQVVLLKLHSTIYVGTRWRYVVIRDTFIITYSSYTQHVIPTKCEKTSNTIQKGQDVMKNFLICHGDLHVHS